MLVDNGFEVGLRATVTRFNHDRMLEVTRTHKELGGSASAFVPVNAIDSDESYIPFDLCPSPALYRQGLKDVYRSGIWPVRSLSPFNEFYTRLKPGFKMTCACGAPWGNTPVVTADGRIFSCIYLVGINKFKVGDIYSEGYPEEKVIGQMLEKAAVDNNNTCRSCGLRYLCGGGCPVGTFLILGNPHVPAVVKNYTRRIACVTSKTVLTELLWDLGRKTWEEADIPSNWQKSICL
jgi:uncharacterized protein